MYKWKAWRAKWQSEKKDENVGIRGQEVGAPKHDGGKTNEMARSIQEKIKLRPRRCLVDSHLELVNIFLINQNFNYSIKSIPLLGN